MLLLRLALITIVCWFWRALLAAGNRTRPAWDAVILKMLGATRRTLVSAFALEYLLIGLGDSGFCRAGQARLRAWFVISRIMSLTFQPGSVLGLP